MGAIVVADLAGALVDSLPGLLAARVGEGVGLVLVVLATPGLLGKVTAPGHRRLVVGAWGAYMPVGSGLAALLVPLAITAWSWRGASVADAVVAACVLLAAWRWVPSAPERPAVSLDRLRWVFRSRTVLVLTAVFTAYSGQYLAVVGLLPAALVADDGFSLAVAGSISALVFLANAPGNFVGAYLLHRGVSPRSLMAAGSVGMGVSVWGVLDAGLPLALRIGAAVAFSATAGLVPSAAFSAVVTASAEADTAGPAVGLMTQGSSLGQLLGPPLVVAVGAAFGSGAARPATLGCLALLALLSACALPRRQPIS